MAEYLVPLPGLDSTLCYRSELFALGV